MKQVLLVCSGNTCRSPMAAALLRKALANRGRGQEVTVLSAGIGAGEGDRAAAFAVDVMRERGLDLSGHRSRRLTDELLAEADLVLTMTAAHKHEVQCQAPREGAKVYTLAEYAGQADSNDDGRGDIKDPFCGSRDRYAAAAASIEELLELVVARWEKEGWWD